MGGVGSSCFELYIVRTLVLCEFNAFMSICNKQIMFIRAWGPAAGSNGQRY